MLMYYMYYYLFLCYACINIEMLTKYDPIFYL